jgi:hypothetical protein
MPSADQVRARLHAGRSYETIARELKIAPGLVYMLATGVPADFSDDLHPGERAAGQSSPTAPSGSSTRISTTLIATRS